MFGVLFCRWAGLRQPLIRLSISERRRHRGSSSSVAIDDTARSRLASYVETLIDAELVAFRIGHDRPGGEGTLLVIMPSTSPPKRGDAILERIAIRHTDVHMQTILGRPGFEEPLGKLNGVRLRTTAKDRRRRPLDV